MNSRLRTIGAASILAVLGFVLYTAPSAAVTRSPQAAPLLQPAATVGDGTVRLFFQVSDEAWLQPIPVYATAFVALIAPSGAAAHWATAAVGALDIALIFLLARRLVDHRLAPYGAALLLTGTPAHFAAARSGTDAIYVVPFVLLWSLCLTGYLRTGRERWIVAAGLALGAGVYSQPAAPLTMAFLLGITAAALAVSGKLTLRCAAAAAGAFMLPLTLAVVWFAAYPHTYPDTFGRWAIHAAHLRFPLDAVRAFINWTTLGNRVSLYWGFFNPAWLFLAGPAQSGTALRGASPFLLACLPMLVLGVRWALTAAPGGVTTWLLGGLAAAPLAASTFGQPHAIESAMAAVPLVVLLATAGLMGALSDSRLGWRQFGWVMAGTAAVGFAASCWSILGSP